MLLKTIPVPAPTSKKPAQKRPVSARRDTLRQVMLCRMHVLERRRHIALAETAVGERVQGTDSECAYFLADLVEVEEEVASGVFRSARRRRAFASARYASRNWTAGDPLLALFAQLDALYRRC